MNDTHFLIFKVIFFFFFYSTSDFRIHIICLKVFTYEHHWEHQGLFWKNLDPFFVFCFFHLVQLKSETLMSIYPYNQRCSLYRAKKPPQKTKNENKKTLSDMITHLSPLLTDPWVPQKLIQLIVYIYFFFLSYFKIVHSWFSGTRHVTVCC